MPHLHLQGYPTTRHRAGVIIDASNDTSIQEEIDLWSQTAQAASAEKDRLARASAVLLEHAVSDIAARFSPRAVIDDLYRPPQGLLRVGGSDSKTRYDN